MCKLETNNRMIDQLLAECSTLVCVFYRFFIADAGEPETLDDYTHTFVIEVRHNDYICLCQCCSASKGLFVLPLKPWFSFPSKFSTGTFTSSKVT